MPARILIIEDNQTNLALMTYLLMAFGHTVHTATDGEEGVAIACREVPDLIVCDVHLPKLDGYGVAAQLKHHPALSAIPLVAVTALAMVGDRDKALDAGFNGYISKPIVPETFVQEVEVFLPSQHTGSSPVLHPCGQTPQEHVRQSKGVIILVVDDSPVNLSLMRSILEPSGYDVLTVSRASEALALARQQPPHLIMSDVHMLGGGGYDFIKAVKADPQLRPIPFIFLSSSIVTSIDIAQGQALGAVRFLRRPIEPQVLLDEIAACLRRRRSDGAVGVHDGNDTGD
jgi:two-component system, cell cycle response regulator